VTEVVGGGWAWLAGRGRENRPELDTVNKLRVGAPRLWRSSYSKKYEVL